MVNCDAVNNLVLGNKHEGRFNITSNFITQGHTFCIPQNIFRQSFIPNFFSIKGLFFRTLQLEIPLLPMSTYICKSYKNGFTIINDCLLKYWGGGGGVVNMLGDVTFFF